MVDTNLSAQFEKMSDGEVLASETSASLDVNHRRRTWVNWALALLTVPGAAFVVLLWFGAVMGLARCGDIPCRHEGPGEFLFGALVYGAPVVAVLTIAVSFYTAHRPRGFVVPAVGWTLLAADVVVLAVSFRP